MATFNDVATATKRILEAVAGVPAVSIRKVFNVDPREAAGEPLCVISFGGDETETWGTTGGSGTDFGDCGKRFRVTITYITVDLGDVQTGLAVVPDFWQGAKRALNTAAMAGVLNSWNVEIDTSEAYENQPFGSGQEVSEMYIHVGVSENRNS